MPLGAKKTEVSSTGRVTRVDVKYAFISSNKLGSIFVPPSAVLPPACADPDLTKYLKAGDIAHFIAVKQRGKNECQWLATKVTLSSKNTIYQEPDNASTSRQQIVTVTSVTETFAYGINEELGMVFIPGAAFPSDEVSKLNSYIACGDSLIVFVRSQAERSGCSWIAEFATKVVGQLPAGVNRNNLLCCSLSAAATPLDSQQFMKGYGKVMETSETEASVCDPLGVIVKCPILTWKGGCRGKIYAEGLNEVLPIGENVYYEAVSTNHGWRAESWNLADSQKKFDAYTQTAITSEQMILRALDDDIIEHLRRKIPHILAFSQL